MNNLPIFDSLEDINLDCPVFYTYEKDIGEDLTAVYYVVGFVRSFNTFACFVNIPKHSEFYFRALQKREIPNTPLLVKTLTKPETQKLPKVF